MVSPIPLSFLVIWHNIIRRILIQILRCTYLTWLGFSRSEQQIPYSKPTLQRWKHVGLIVSWLKVTHCTLKRIGDSLLTSRRGQEIKVGKIHNLLTFTGAFTDQYEHHLHIEAGELVLK